MNLQRSTIPHAAAAVILMLSLGACGPGNEVEIELVRQAPPEASFARPDATSRERFGGGQEAQHDHEQPAEPTFEWNMPAGWVELAPKQFRDVNLRPGGHPELECYLTVLAGSGGGLTANVNRWRSQFGLESISDEEAEALPEALLFGRPAVRVELLSEGDDARALFGVIFMDTSTMATVKMTGPAELVEGERPNFDLFCATLAVRRQTAPGGSSSDATQGAQDTLKFDMPEGWSDAGASSIRIVNLVSPGSSQCYVVRLAGEAGGMVNNLNRWRGEVGLEPLGQAELEALPKVEFLGTQCNLLEVSGEYHGMGGQAGAGKTLLGVALIGSESSLFVKMVGSEADVAAEKQRFLDFLGSLIDA